jgi:hypothetical protein
LIVSAYPVVPAKPYHGTVVARGDVTDLLQRGGKIGRFNPATRRVAVVHPSPFGWTLKAFDDRRASSLVNPPRQVA